MAGELDILNESLDGNFIYKELEDDWVGVYKGETFIGKVSQLEETSRRPHEWVFETESGVRLKGTTFKTRQEAAEEMYNRYKAKI